MNILLMCSLLNYDITHPPLIRQPTGKTPPPPLSPQLPPLPPYTTTTTPHQHYHPTPTLPPTTTPQHHYHPLPPHTTTTTHPTTTTPTSLMCSATRSLQLFCITLRQVVSGLLTCKRKSCTWSECRLKKF